jgi:NAD+ synthase
MVETQKGSLSENFEGRKAQVLEIYKRLNTSNHHKMQAIPICLLPDKVKLL